jgi:RND superfamily putative drug exporter
MADLPPFPLRHRLPLIAAWAIALAVLVPRSAHLERSLEVGVRVAGSESSAVEQELASRFGSPYAQFALLVVQDARPPTSPEGRRFLDALAARVRRVSGVTAVRGYQGPADTLLLGLDGRTSLLVVGLDGVHASPDTIVLGLREATATVSGATLHWTGQAVLNADLRRLSADDASNAERRVLPLSLLLLLVAFGTLVAALLPVLAGALTILLAFGAAAVLAARWPLSITLQNVVTMIGLGLGIDYALLTVSRFREGLAAGRSPREAAADTVRHAGHTVALSGLAVAVGFAGLLAIPVNELRSVAVGGLVTVTFAVLLAVTLLPAGLAWMGPFVNRAALPLVRPPTARRLRWQRWSRWVTRRPVLVLVTAGIPVAALAWQARRLQIGEPSSDWLPPRMESAVALRELERAERSGILQTIRVVLELPGGAGIQTAQGWAAARRTQQRLAAFPDVAFVRSIASPDGARPLSRLLFFTTPDSTLRTLVARDRGAVLFEVVPREGADPIALSRLVGAFRALDVPALTGLSGARVQIGGLPAFRVDYVSAVRGALPLVVLMIVVGTLMSLAWGFRSLLIPLKAVALNLLSVAAGFGAVVLVFQDGHGITWLGLSAPVDQVFVAVPALVFCAVFGLSMDYEVFLVSRVAEARRRGLPEAEAIAEGLARTGPVITSAAAIMVVVFGAFTLGQFLMLRMLGLALSVTILVDATLVRAAIGPALLALAGRWNWWPGDRRRVPSGTAAAMPVLEAGS